MTWNYRVVKSKTDPGDVEYLSIRTAWYDEGNDVPHSIGDMPMYPVGENMKELAADLTIMQLAFTKPILNEEDFEKKDLDRKESQ